MQYRCINAFIVGDRVVAGGAVIEDGDPILSTHRDLFAPVNVPATPVASETAAAAVPRVKQSPRKSAKAASAE